MCDVAIPGAVSKMLLKHRNAAVILRQGQVVWIVVFGGLGRVKFLFKSTDFSRFSTRNSLC